MSLTRRIVGGGVLLMGVAFGVCLLLPSANEDLGDRDRVTQELMTLCPNDPLLASRMATERLYVALEVAKREGEAGLRTVDIFGDDAVYLFEQKPEIFRDLMQVEKLDGPLYSGTVGDWRKAVVEWAMAGTLRHYLSAVGKLDDQDQNLFRRVPQALPLLVVDAPIAKEMLRRYEARAWHLFMLVDFARDGKNVERMATALRDSGELLLEVNERYGFAVALMFVAPPGDKEAAVPRLLRHAMAPGHLAPDVAVSLFLSNYECLLQMVLSESCPPDRIREGLDLLAAQPDEIRCLAPDSSYCIRLLLERDEADPIGLTALAQCGPLAADVLFARNGYGALPQGQVSETLLRQLHTERRSALLIMKHVGWQGLRRLLLELRGWGPWYKLLRRPDLQEPKDDPLIARIARKLVLTSNIQDEVEALNKMPRRQIEEAQYPPRAVEEALLFIPGYLAVSAVYDVSRGYHLAGSDVAWAVVDGVFTATMIGGLVGDAIKTTAKQGGRAILRETAEVLERRAAEEIAEAEVKQLGREAFSHLPSAMYAFVKNLPTRIARVDITKAMRAASGIAKKVGIPTWGKLDRRIIMRADRVVVVDFTNPTFLKDLGNTGRNELAWSSVAEGVNELTPCIMEKVVPQLKGTDK